LSVVPTITQDIARIESIEIKEAEIDHWTRWHNPLNPMAMIIGLLLLVTTLVCKYCVFVCYYKLLSLFAILCMRVFLSRTQ
jgi:hypothetical protein